MDAWHMDHGPGCKDARAPLGAPRPPRGRETITIEVPSTLALGQFHGRLTLKMADRRKDPADLREVSAASPVLDRHAYIAAGPPFEGLVSPRARGYSRELESLPGAWRNTRPPLPLGKYVTPPSGGFRHPAPIGD